MQSQAFLNASIEAWIDHLVHDGGPTILMPDEPDTLPSTAERDATTPRRASKRQRQTSGPLDVADLEATPRPSLPCLSSARHLSMFFTDTFSCQIGRRAETV